MNNTIINTLRWIGILPVAIITFTILFYVLQFVGSFIGLYNSLPWLLYLITSVVSFSAAIVAGSITAPSKNKIVALALSILVVFINGFALYGNLSYQEYYGIIEVVGGIIGAIVGYFQSTNHINEK